MKQLLTVTLLVVALNVNGQINSFPFPSKCNKTIKDSKDIQCWFENTDIANDISNLISDSCIESVTTVNNSPVGIEAIFDISLNERRPAIYNSHIYCFIKNKEVYYLNCDSLLIDRSNFYVISILRNKLLSQKYNSTSGKINKGRNVLLWQNSECESIDFQKSISSFAKAKDGFCIRLFIHNDCKDNDRTTQRCIK